MLEELGLRAVEGIHDLDGTAVLFEVRGFGQVSRYAHRSEGSATRIAVGVARGRARGP